METELFEPGARLCHLLARLSGAAGHRRERCTTAEEAELGCTVAHNLPFQDDAA